MSSEPSSKNESVFKDFTRKYALSKTLRFELKPVGKTEEFLKQNKIFEKDKTIDDSYQQAKFYFDSLHQKFIDSALASEHLGSLRFVNFAKFLEEKNKEILSLRKEAARVRKERNNAQTLQDKIRVLEKEIENKKQNSIKIFVLFWIIKQKSGKKVILEKN